MKKIYLIRETKKFMTAELNNWGATNYIYIYIYIINLANYDGNLHNKSSALCTCGEGK